VGGSTIYLGDSVSIKATSGGTLTATNAAGTVNLITAGGINGGTLSGSGTTTTVDGQNYYGSHSFSPPFTSIPIVVASIASVSNISSKLAVDTTNLSATGCRIYSDTNGASYNWVATARTEFTFSFYNSVTPVTLVTANSTSLVLSVNTSLLIRGGTVPYNNLRLNSTNSSFSPVAININTGTQTITISSLTANTQYTVNITVTDSSTPTAVSLTSSNQSFTTAYSAIIAASIGLITPNSNDRTNYQIRFSIGTEASGGSGQFTNDWQYKASNVANWPNTPDTFSDGTLPDVTYDTTYNIRLKTTDTTTNLFAYSNTVNATLYEPLSIDDGDVSYPESAVTSGDVVTISISMATLFIGGVAPYSFNIEGLLNAPLNFALDLAASGLSGNSQGIANNTFSFSDEQTTYLRSNNKTLVYEWTSSGTSASYTFNLAALSGDGQTFTNSGTPYSFSITGGGGSFTGGSLTATTATAVRLKYTRTEATGGSGSYEYILHWEQVSDTSINGTVTTYSGGEYTIDPLIPDTEYKVWLETTDTGTSTTVNADGSISSITSETAPYPQISIGSTSIDQIVLGYTTTDAAVNKNTANTISILEVTAGATGSATISPNYIYKVCYSIQSVVDPTFVVSGNEWVISNTNLWTDTPPFGYGGLNITNLEPFTEYNFTVYVYDQTLLDLNVEYVTPVFIPSYSTETTTLFTTPTLTTAYLDGPLESGTFIYTGEITSYGGGDLVTQGSEGFGLCYDLFTEPIPTIDDNKTPGNIINDTTNQFTITVAVTAGDYNVSGYVQNSEGTTLTAPQLVNVTVAPT
jgi:hypothetical protein